MLRPPELRKYTYRLRKRTRENWPYFLANDYIDTILPGGFCFMNQFFDIDRIGDSEQFSRICTLEYLFRRFEPALAG